MKYIGAMSSERISELMALEDKCRQIAELAGKGLSLQLTSVRMQGERKSARER